MYEGYYEGEGCGRKCFAGADDLSEYLQNVFENWPRLPEAIVDTVRLLLSAAVAFPGAVGVEVQERLEAAFNIWNSDLTQCEDRPLPLEILEDMRQAIMEVFRDIVSKKGDASVSSDGGAVRPTVISSIEKVVIDCLDRLTAGVFAKTPHVFSSINV